MDYYIRVALLTIIVALLVVTIVLYRKVAKLTTIYNEFMKGKNGTSLEEEIMSLFKEMRRLEAGVSANADAIADIRQVVDTCVRGIGIVRFNAFQNTGSDLSFAIACLDAAQNGVVLSSIYGREESRTYAKPVTGGQSPYQLSEEELAAIRRASAAVRPFAAGPLRRQG